MENLNYKPIGYLRCAQKYKSEAPRQSSENYSNQTGEIILEGGYNFELTLRGLEGFERLWLIYEFHKNKNWRPLTETPRATKKQGVFATRAPYRPNPIGLSCVKLDSFTGRKIKIKEFDLLDGTPILDIKPYIPSCDSFQVTNNSWIESEKLKEVTYSEEALEKMLWLEKNGLPVFRQAIEDQLKRDPVNSNKKRVKLVSGVEHCLSFRTWRVFFDYLPELNKCHISAVKTGYIKENFTDDSDPYGDKQLHKDFVSYFSSTDSA